MTHALLQPSLSRLEAMHGDTEPSEYADIISRSVLVGVGKYLRLVVANRVQSAQEIEPARLIDFPYFDATVPEAELLNGINSAARIQFLKRATDSPKSIPVHMEFATGEAELLHQIRAISTMGRVVLLEHTQFGENGNTIGQTYWAQPDTILESPYLHPILGD